MMNYSVAHRGSTAVAARYFSSYRHSQVTAADARRAHLRCLRQETKYLHKAAQKSDNKLVVAVNGVSQGGGAVAATERKLK